MPSLPVSEDSLSEAELLARLFPNGGEMGERIRQLDWSATLLGPVHGWPQSLRTAVSIMLGSRFPMMVHWGPELVHFYNDGYATILQTKHPGALGQPAKPWWLEMWPFLLEIFGPVLAGQTTYFENSLVLPNRQGFIEEAYFTFSHSPIYNEQGTVGGIFVTALETTTTVVQHRRLALLSQLTAQTALAAELAEAAQHIMAALSTNTADIPFALLYTHDQFTPHAQLRAWFGLPAGEPTAPATLTVVPQQQDRRGWPLATVLAQHKPLHIPSLEECFGPLPPGLWPEAPTQALLLPLAMNEAVPLQRTVLIVGVHPRRPLDEAYRAFFDLVADYASRALVRATVISEARRLNQALREINESLDSFVHIVAHDLRGPVTNLDSLIKAYYEETPGPDREYIVGFLQQEIQRLGGTTQGLMQVLQAQYAAAIPTDMPVAWHDVYVNVRSEVSILLAQQQGTLTADFQAASITGYPQAFLESILKNLVTNALKYRSPERAPVVRVHTFREGKTTLLLVADNGRGIDLLKDRERLFQPFTRLTAEGEGAGLGLHMIRTLIYRRNGTLEVDSALGLGTTFTVRLPE
ncbi:HAMP domain-containing sensor histidine kinase [Hymenobacter sp. ASUV-10]|uniref:histidine kinase n=1 Tax=Hymenobacter aranciens TaxID=3063996 RepID=A0ABT9BCP1_9BACT|nr:HAMP domain-containing sensor histidine kinase [Hymenobacter sp. ASUV-10]MDO7875545.1 HAMP domain-containing sensor histidine kinase [Hymenobacter sp. ASUV-10]